MKPQPAATVTFIIPIRNDDEDDRKRGIRGQAIVTLVAEAMNDGQSECRWFSKLRKINNSRDKDRDWESPRPVLLWHLYHEDYEKNRKAELD